MTGPPLSAARRYQEITAGMNDAVEQIRREDAERARRLRDELIELSEEMEAAANREALTVLGVALRWEAALESLWNEHWMTLSPLPKPDRDALPHDVDYLDAVVEQRFEALREAIRRRSLLGRR
jgi:hypothetical protein